MSLYFGCCVSSDEKVEAFVRPYVGGRPCVEVRATNSIPRAYNAILDYYQMWDVQWPVVLLHDDLEVTDPEADVKIMQALLEPGVALVGVCGGSARNGLAWWSADPVGHQMIDTGLIDFGQREGDVESLEGSFMVFAPRAVRDLRFDERFTGFHGYDHIGLRARARGKRVVVRDIDTHHHTRAGFKDQASEAAWNEADRKFREWYL